MALRLPTIQGLIRRRILANFRVDPDVFQRNIPSRFKPKLHNGYAVAGICLIRLEQIRPNSVPASMGISSENAAHRFAVEWDDEGVIREGVFISRRDTNSKLNHVLGGRVFPGEHHEASFEVSDHENEIRFSMRSVDNEFALELEASKAADLPPTSIFSSLDESSSFFEGGSVGFSVTSKQDRLDGLKLETKEWTVEPLEVHRIVSSFFESENRFPGGSAQFDHALIMRNIEHEWHSVKDLYI